MHFPGFIPARFLILIAHIILTILILWWRDDNVKACLPVIYTPDQYTTKDTQFIIALSISLGLFALELISFMAGVSMFTASQSLLLICPERSQAIGAHFGAVITLIFFMFENWSCDVYWFVFGFCCAFPALTEIGVVIGKLGIKKAL